MSQAQPHDIDEIRRGLLEGLSDRQIGCRLGRSTSSIRWTRERFDLGQRVGCKFCERPKITPAKADARFRQALGAGEFPSYEIPSAGPPRIDRPATALASASSAADAVAG